MKKRSKTEIKWNTIAKEKGYKNRYDLLKSLFIKYNKSSKEVAYELDVSVTTIRNHLNRFKIKIPPKNNKNSAKKYKWEELAKEYNFKTVKNFIIYIQENYDIIEACELFGCSKSTLYRETRRYKKEKKKRKIFVKKTERKMELNTERKKCECCNKEYVKKGFKYLCENCWKNNGYLDGENVY